MGFLSKHLAPQASIFRGAQSNRLTLDWIFGTLSADDELKAERFELVHRARELRKNTGWAANFVRLVTTNVIGPHGIRLQSRLTTPGGEPMTTANQRHEDAWMRWQEDAGLAGEDWPEVERLLLETWATDGEALAIMHDGADNPFGFAIQVVDTDQLDDTFNRTATETEPEVSMGVEVNGNGRPVAYHFYREHPTSSRGRRSRERIRVPAENVIHLFHPWRAGQHRGIPPLTPIMLDMHWGRSYQQSEMIASRQAAVKGGFFVTPADGFGGPEPTDNSEGRRATMDFSDGVWEELPAGTTFEAYDPNHPTTAYPEFMRSILRAQAAGIGISYSSYAGDLSDVNFSSLRDGKLSERDMWRVLQQWVIRKMHRKVHRRWARMARLTRKVPVTFSVATLTATSVAKWQPRGWDWVDPEKDIRSAERAILNGLDSRSRIAAERGRDFEDIVREQARENDIADRAGVEFAIPITHRKESEAAPTLPGGNGNGNGGGDEAAVRRMHLDAFVRKENES